MRTWTALVASMVLVACASESESVSRSSNAVLNGARDDEHKAVVAIVANFQEMCSAYLVTPDLLVTARHCVSPMMNAAGGCVGSDASPPTMAGAPYAPSSIEAYTETEPSETSKPITGAEVFVLSGDRPLCGNDVALVRLSVPIQGVTPLSMRLDGPPVVGEEVTITGYGAAEGGPDTTSGTRRMVKGSTVSAVDPMPPRTVDGEWIVNIGPCAGDSGSPAIDSSGAAIGIMSRGSKATCKDMVYERVDSHAAFIREHARASYQRLGLDVPAWIDPKAATTDAGDAGGEPALPPMTAPEGTCSVGRAGGSFGAPMMVIVAAVIAARRRRRA